MNNAIYLQGKIAHYNVTVVLIYCTANFMLLQPFVSCENPTLHPNTNDLFFANYCLAKSVDFQVIESGFCATEDRCCGFNCYKCHLSKPQQHSIGIV